MTNQEILEKAIQKAIDGGWRPINAWVSPKTNYEWREREDYGGYYILCKKYIHDKESESYESAEQLIFNHDFAKALWQDPDYGTWHHHLQNMVIAEDPIKYLGENV